MHCYERRFMLSNNLNFHYMRVSDTLIFIASVLVTNHCPTLRLFGEAVVQTCVLNIPSANNTAKFTTRLHLIKIFHSFALAENSAATLKYIHQ